MINPKNFWETFDKAYQMGEQKHRMFLLNKIISSSNTDILDVGCGTGPLYEIIKNNDLPLEYKGVDYSRSMIEVASKMFPEADFEVQDARRLKERDKSWDSVVLMHSLDHLDDYKSAIKEACRVAKEHVFVVLWRPLREEGTNLNSINRMGKNDDEEPWEDTHLQEYSKDIILEEFEKNNFVLVDEEYGTEVNEEGKYNHLFMFWRQQ